MPIKQNVLCKAQLVLVAGIIMDSRNIYKRSPMAIDT